MTALELCAGAGGQALGIDQAGFEHLALVELDAHACSTLKVNRPDWNVVRADLNDFATNLGRGQVDLVAGGLPCPPFSKAGKQLGSKDERNLFPAALRIIDQIRPKAVMIENVRGLMDAVFFDYRSEVEGQLRDLGYEPDWKLLNACDFGVPQLRPRVVFVAIQKRFARHFYWPQAASQRPQTVGETLYDLMGSNGWQHVDEWRNRANEIAPTIVGGSKKHGGPDLGPTRAKRAWASLGVDGHGVANAPPVRNFVGMPKLTVEMVALIQGFPHDWIFTGKKTNAYRQIGNAFPPPVARAVAERILHALTRRRVVTLAG